ncbi:MAG: sugar phosphate isomerase/epimerase [Oscillospiraceae bacterium]|nr:sugar phosphate isomerase/epimerase [Oscillospiraceae bacterium]
MHRRLKIGHTGITWAGKDIETAVATISKLGYHGVEVFGADLDRLEKEGRSDLFDRYDIPLISSYCSINLVDPSAKEDSFNKIARWGSLMKKHGAKYICLGGDSINRMNYNYNDYKDYILNMVNEAGRRFADMGLALCYHPHTGTPIETAHEIRTLMEGVDAKVVAFAPDVGQIQKGGADAVQIVKDYLELVRHVHFKDYDGVPVKYTPDGKEIDSSGFACYTPLGKGIVDLPAILDLLEMSAFDNMVMVELDGGETVPMPQEEALTISRDYLKELGYSFRERK